MRDGAISYDVVFGSDVDRDGVFVELTRVEAGARYPIVEIFRSDADGSYTVGAADEAVPELHMTQLLDQVRSRLAGRGASGV